jgi:hypothetical protein
VCLYRVWRGDALLHYGKDQTLFCDHLLTFEFRRYERVVVPLSLYETWLDTQAWWRKTTAWVHGLYRDGFKGARLAAAGLAY